MITLSDEAKRLASAFVAYRNDIDIYTEDEDNDKEFYQTLLRRLIDTSIKINDITPLGSKSNVIERCKNEPNNGRRKLFIIDGDIATIHQVKTSPIPHLFILEAYCIENLVFEEDAIIDHIYFNCGTKSKDSIKNELKFTEWIDEYAPYLIPLFFHFAILDYINERFTLYNFHKYYVRTGKKLSFDHAAIASDIEAMRIRILDLISEEDYQKHLTDFRNRWPQSCESFLSIISGKSYLIPMIQYKCSEIKGSGQHSGVSEIKLRLASSCRLDRLASLKATIEST